MIATIKYSIWYLCIAVLSLTVIQAQQKTVTGEISVSGGEPMPGVSILVKGTTMGTISGVDGKFTVNVPDNQSILVFSFGGYQTQEITVGEQTVVNVTMRESVSRPISGTALSSETGLPIPGVAVRIPGVASSITDDEGKFNLARSEEGAVLQFNIHGYAYKEVAAGGKTEIIVKLHDESFPTMYQSVGSPFGYRDWVKTSASVISISNREYYKKGVVSPENMIQDEGLGVNTVMRSGAPGAGANMFMRGFTSINATNQPMIVIDGVPYENSATAPSLVNGNQITALTCIDVRDIENITVLKDATSIYGSKGANGVILIETVKAKEQATKIDFHAYAALNPAHSTLYPMMNAWQYKSYITEMLANSGQYTPMQIQALPFINQEKPVVDQYGRIDGNRDFYRYNKDTDWQKEVFKSSNSQNYYLSIKGGDDIALYALSVGVLNRGGVVGNTGFNRYNTQFNSQINANAWLKINANMNFSYGARQLAFESNSPNFNPLYVGLIKAPFMSPYIYNVENQQTPNFEQVDIFGVSNPVALIDEQTVIRDISYRFFGNLGFIGEINKNLNVGITAGVVFDKLRESVFLPQNGLNHDALPSSWVDNQSTATISRYFQYYGDTRLTYQRDFNRKHAVLGRVGFRYQTNKNNANWIEAYNSSSDDLKSVGNGNLDLASTSGMIGEWRWMSTYLTAEYGYLKKYLLDLNIAMDGSSRFGKEAKGLKMGDAVFGIFPSITGAWVVSSEQFMDNVNIDMLKLRLGFSRAGNDDIGNYSSRVVYPSQNFFGFYGLVRGNIANPELRWETVTRLNFGVDVATFGERLRIGFDLYQSKTTDLLGWRQGEDYYGIKNYAVNDGSMTNRGFDLGIHGRILNRAVKWDLGVNIAHYKNKITTLSIDETMTQIAGANILTKVGKPVGLFYGYKTDGVYATSEQATSEGLHIQRGDGFKIPFQAGDVRFVNMNSDDVIDEKDMTIIGDPNPNFIGSFTSRLQWKRLVLSAVFTYSYGNDVYNGVRASLESMTGSENQTMRVVNRWNREGHETLVPRAVWGDPMDNARFSDRWIEDGSYIRLKNVSLSYDIPIRLSFITGLQVYVTANNLVTFTKYLGYDPEFSMMQSPLAYGIDAGMAPIPKSFLFGIKLGL